MRADKQKLAAEIAESLRQSGLLLSDYGTTTAARDLIARYLPDEADTPLDERIKRIVHRVVTDRNVVVRTNGVDDDVLALARGETIEWPGFEEWCRSYEKRGYR